MRAWGVVVAGVLLWGCAGQKAEVKPSPQAGQGGSGEAGTSRRYVDRELGFEVSRPTSVWEMDVSSDEVEGIATPVVLRNAETGAQVVIQVAPAVASPHQFAERLTEGMRAQPGFITSDPEPLPLGEDAVGFRFAMGDRVYGRVAVRNGTDGRILMLLATWPAGAPDSAPGGVDDVFRSVLPLEVLDVAPHK